jgi:hypothetical protein
VGAEFLSQFHDLAERAVYISDGTMDVTGSIDLYVQGLARQIAPVRLSGVCGGEILRRLTYTLSLNNNISQLGTTQANDTRAMMYSGALRWQPTTGEFGPRGGFGDLEHHDHLATQFGVSAGTSIESRYAPLNTATRAWRRGPKDRSGTPSGNGARVTSPHRRQRRAWLRAAGVL